MRPGEVFNESVELTDDATARPTRRLTRTGLYNNTPTYHLGACFSADSRYLVFGTAREGGSALIRAEVASGDLQVIARTDGMAEVGDFSIGGPLGGGFNGNGLAMIPATNRAAAVVGNSLRVYDLDTLRERVLIEDVGKGMGFGNPVGSIDGRQVIVTRSPTHPDIAAGIARPKRPYFEALVATYGGRPTTYLRIDIESGRIEEVFHEAVFGSNHVQPCPADPDLWLIDRDAPPLFSWGGDHGRMTRAWLLDTRTRALTELRPRSECRFQIHTNWDRTGKHVFYHGRLNHKDNFVGVADRSGAVVWEGWYPRFRYGHMSTHTRASAIVTEGIVSDDLIVAMHYEELDSQGFPRIEILGRHATRWESMPGQYAHPHCHMSPDGRWLSYNRGEGGRSDVYVLRLA